MSSIVPQNLKGGCGDTEPFTIQDVWSIEFLKLVMAAELGRLTFDLAGALLASSLFGTGELSSQVGCTEGLAHFSSPMRNVNELLPL